MQDVENEFYDGQIVEGDLDLWTRKRIVFPENLTITGALDLRGCTIQKLPTTLNVGGWLDLRRTKIIEPTKNLIIGGSCFLRGSNAHQLSDNLIVGGMLDLSESDITKLPQNTVVAGSLYFNNTIIEELPDGLVVGQNLNLNKSRITHLPQKLSVGGYISGCKEAIDGRYFLSNGDYEEGRYLYENNTLTPIKEKRQINGYAFYVGKFEGKNVVSDGTYYAHCETFEQGIQDIESRKKDIERILKHGNDEKKI